MGLGFGCGPAVQERSPRRANGPSAAPALPTALTAPSPASLGSQFELNRLLSWRRLCDRPRGEPGRDPWGGDGGREVMGQEQEAFPPRPGSGVGRSCHKMLGGCSSLAKPQGLLSLCRHPAGPAMRREDKVFDSSYLEQVDHAPGGEFSRPWGQSPPPRAPNDPPHCQLLSREVPKAPLERLPSLARSSSSGTLCTFVLLVPAGRTAIPCSGFLAVGRALAAGVLINF